MEKRLSSGPARPRRLLLSALILVFLTGCATTQLAEENHPSEAEALEVGYGTIDRDHLVGSLDPVYGDEGEIVRARTWPELLSRLSGVRVRELRSGQLSVQIRGGGALYVVDGMIFQGSLRSINPNTVESITVLKNAGESAIYGSRAGHGGVILIKTKRG